MTIQAKTVVYLLALCSYTVTAFSQLNDPVLLWSGGLGYSPGGSRSTLSHDTSLLALKGSSGFAVYRLSHPIQLLVDHQSSTLEPGRSDGLPCFNEDGTRLFIVSDSAVSLYDAPDYHFVKTVPVAHLNGAALMNAETEPTLRFFSSDSSIVILYRNNYAGGAAYRLKITVHDSGCVLMQQDSIVPGSDVGSAPYLCTLNGNGSEITVVDAATSSPIDTVQTSGSAQYVTTNGHYIAYYTNDTIVVWDRSTKSVHAVFGRIDHRLWNDGRFSTTLAFINDSLLISTNTITNIYNLSSNRILASFPNHVRQWLTMPSRQELLLLHAVPSYNGCISTDAQNFTMNDSLARFTVMKYNGKISDSNCDTTLVPKPMNAEYSRDGRLIAVQENYSTTKIVDAATGRVQSLIPSVGVLGTDARSYFCYENDSIISYSIVDAVRSGAFAIGHKSLSVLLATSDNEESICAASAQHCSLFDLHTGAELHSVDVPIGESCVAVHYANRDSTLLILTTHNRLYRWSTSTGELGPDLLLLSDSNYSATTPYAFSSDGSRFARNRSVYSTTDGEMLFTDTTVASVHESDVQLSNDGAILFVDDVVRSGMNNNDEDAFLTSFSVRDHKVLTRTLLNNANGPLLSIAGYYHHRISPDNTTYVEWADCFLPVQYFRLNPASEVSDHGALANTLRCMCSEGALVVRVGTTAYTSIAITNLLGQVVYQHSGDLQSEWQIPVMNWPEGVYLVGLSNSWTSTSCTALVTR